MDDAVVRRPFDAASSATSRPPARCPTPPLFTHPAFDGGRRRRGDGFHHAPALTGPVVDEHGRVVAVVQLVNKGGGGEGALGARAKTSRGWGGEGGEGEGESAAKHV